MAGYEKPKGLQSFLLKNEEHDAYSLKQLLGLRYYEIKEPELMEKILKANDHLMNMEVQKNLASHVMGNALINSDGEVWQKKRALFQSYLTPKTLTENTAPFILKEIKKAVASWTACAEGTEVEIEDEMRKISGRIICNILFGDTIDKKTADEMIDIISEASIQSFHGLTRKGVMIRALGLNKIFSVLNGAGGALPEFYKSKEYEEGKERLDGILYSIIEKRRALESQPKDVLGAMIDPPVNPRTGEKKHRNLSDNEIRDELIMFVVAGHETTTIALTFSMIEIANDEKTLGAIRDEIKSALGDREDIEVKDFRNLGHLKKAFKEAIRMHPPAHSVSREVKKDFSIGDLHFKKGDYIKVHLPDLLKSEHQWKDAGEYKPERMDSAFNKEKEFVAFSKGQRSCPGMSLSFIEGAFILSEVFSKANVEILSVPEREDYNSIATRIIGSSRAKITPI
jgi:cytochrome P450